MRQVHSSRFTVHGYLTSLRALTFVSLSVTKNLTFARCKTNNKSSRNHASVNRQPLAPRSLGEAGSTVNHSGQVLIIALIILTVVAILTASLFDRTSNLIRFGAGSVTREQANSLAEAGIERALWQLNQTAGSYTGETNTTLGSTGTFTVTVANKSQNIKTITATGFVPNATNPRSKRKIKMDVAIDTTTIAFNYAVQVGTGGVDMSNSATIKGNVYSNKTGVSIQGANSSKIEGDAFTVGTISTPDPTVTGTKHENQDPSEMPTIDYQYWKDAASVGDVVTCSPTCTISSNTTIGPIKYDGNLEVTNNALVTITGPVYITGNFAMSQGLTKIKVDNAQGSNGTVLLADGTINLTQGGTFEPTNANPKGYLLVATTSTSTSAMSISQAGQTALFYALEGTTTLSQTAQVTALVAKGLTMTQSSELQYEQGLASATFTTGPGASWQPVKGTYKYSN